MDGRIRMDGILNPLSENPPPRNDLIVATAVKIGVVTLTLWFISGYLLAPLGDSGMILNELILIIPACVYIRYCNLDFRVMFRLQSINTITLSGSVVAGFALTVLSNVIYVIFLKMYPMPGDIEQQMQTLMGFGSTLEVVLLIVSSVLAAAFCEELFFRGFLQGHLEKVGTPVLAIVVTSMIFCLLHPIWWIPSTFFNGFLLALIAYASRSVYPCIVLHIIHNGIALGLSGLPINQGLWVMESLILNPIVVVGSAVLLCGFLLYLFRIRILETAPAVVPVGMRTQD